MRLFVAVYPPEDVREELQEWLRAALDRGGKTVRLTPIERWHLTLAFIGEVRPERLPEVELVVSRVAVDGPAHDEIRLRLSGGGSFGRGRSGALWAGVDGDVDVLRAIHTELQQGLAASELPCDERPFTPHLTVTYAGGPEVQAALRDFGGQIWMASEMVLVHSRHDEGLGYETLRTWSLL